jgi:hypothetical protein
MLRTSGMSACKGKHGVQRSRPCSVTGAVAVAAAHVKRITIGEAAEYVLFWSLQIRHVDEDYV